MKAWCSDCCKQVEVFWDEIYDEDDTEVSFPLCAECFTGINRCYNCLIWKPESKNTPLSQTYGQCRRRHDKRIHASSLVCGYFKEG